MEPTEAATNSLNASQKLHLLTSSQHADKLLGEIEFILAASASKSPFPKYRQDIAPTQAKVVRDYIARIRARMIRALESQGVRPPDPSFGSLHSIRVTLGFAGIAFDECRSKKMRGYGELPPSAVPELDGLADVIGKLHSYLAQGLGQDLETRLRKLQSAGAGVTLAKSLEHIVNRHGLVEFRAALANIVDRLESTSFEIAFFGRVSSGKSSLLNRILQNDVLPVGVTPVTAVPTRIVYGPLERAAAWFADRGPEYFELGRLREFATEAYNPANGKHVTRIVVELPCARLQDGITYVDTPGLGSLATTGSAETLAYLPRCDLGVVLIDAGSALAADDLSTIRALHDAAIPAIVLLSKSDLLASDDLERVRQYVADHIASELNLNLLVPAVSAKPEHAELLESWFTSQILPLYGRHAELSRESLSRKIGALRAGVDSALRSKLRQPGRREEADDSQFRMLETELRKASGRFANVRSEGLGIADEIRESGDIVLTRAAMALVDAWSQNGASAANATTILASAMEQFAAAKVRPFAVMLDEISHGSADVLARIAEGLALGYAPDASEFTGVLKDLPRLDTAMPEIGIRPGRSASALGSAWAIRRVEKQLRSQIGDQVAAALSSHGKRLESWFRRTTSELQARFYSYADTYRAQLERLTNRNRATPEEEATIGRDLTEIGLR